MQTWKSGEERKGIGSGRWDESRSPANGKADSPQVLHGQRIAKKKPTLFWFQTFCSGIIEKEIPQQLLSHSSRFRANHMPASPELTLVSLKFVALINCLMPEML